MHCPCQRHWFGCRSWSRYFTKEQNVSCWNHTMQSSFQHTSQQVIHFQSWQCSMAWHCNSMLWHCNSNFEWFSTPTFLKFKWQTFLWVDVSQITQWTHALHFISSLTANPHILLSIPAALANIVLHKWLLLLCLCNRWACQPLKYCPGIITSYWFRPQPVACSIRLDALLWQPWWRRRWYLSFTWGAC
jgi:hypothetical protein